MAVRVGERAPAFTLAGTGDRSYSLSDYAGTPVVLVFYPGDNTPVCTNQLNTYTKDIGQFEAAGAQVLAVSPQDVASHEQFSCKQGGFAFPLLADTDKAGKADTEVDALASEITARQEDGLKVVKSLINRSQCH